jgi:CheY-like chemotaxis protein
MGHGTGLGLSTVQGIVYQNRGEIHLTSEVGKGTTVVVEFPLYYGPDYGAPTAESPPRPLASKRILVVDDEADIVEFLTQVLATQGHEVQSAESAESALKWAQADRGFDLLVTDVMLPGKNGRQLANELAASIPGLVVLYISGYSGDVLAEQGVLGPDVHFLQKPFTLSEVTAKLSAILNA